MRITTDRGYTFRAARLYEARARLNADLRVSGPRAIYAQTDGGAEIFASLEGGDFGLDNRGRLLWGERPTETRLEEMRRNF